MNEIYLITNDGFSIIETRTKPIEAKLRYQGDLVRVYVLNLSNRRVASHRWNYAALIACENAGLKNVQLRDVDKKHRPRKAPKHVRAARKHQLPLL